MAGRNFRACARLFEKHGCIFVDAEDALTRLSSMSEFLPVSGVIPTRNRAQALARTLESLGNQSAQPAELIVVDASENAETRTIVEQRSEKVPGDGKIIWRRASSVGA